MNGNWQELLLISAALKTGLLQSVAAEKQTAEELASKHAYNLRATEIVMEALYELGLVGRDRAHYEIRPAAAPYVDKNHPFYVANSLLHDSRLLENWTNLASAIKTGKSQTRRRSPEELEIFLRSMDEYSRHIAENVISIILKERPQANTILDLGGALGTYAKLFAAKGLDVTLIDTLAVTEQAKKELSGTPVKIVAGDFTKALPEGKFDIVLLSNITHIYKPEKLVQLFQQVAGSLVDNGVAVIVELIRGKSKGAAMFGVNMLLHTAGGGTWTLPQYELWLREAGLKIKSVKDMRQGEALLIIERA